MFVPVRQGDGAVFVGACGDIAVIDAKRFRDNEMLAVIDTSESATLPGSLLPTTTPTISGRSSTSPPRRREPVTHPVSCSRSRLPRAA